MVHLKCEVRLRLLRPGFQIFYAAFEHLLPPFTAATDFFFPFAMHFSLTSSQQPVGQSCYTYLDKDRNQGSPLRQESTRYCGPIIFLLGGGINLKADSNTSQ